MADDKDVELAKIAEAGKRREESGRRFIEACTIVKRSGYFAATLLGFTWLSTRFCPRTQSDAVLSDAVILFFTAVIFVGSLCFAWNVYRDHD